MATADDARFTWKKGDIEWTDVSSTKKKSTAQRLADQIKKKTK